MAKAQRYLFVTWEGGGNVPPVLGLAARLVNKGHQVSVLAEPCLQTQIDKIGAEYIPFKKHFTRTDRAIDLIQDWKAKPLTVPSIDNILINPAQSVAEETLNALDKTKANVVVADFMMPGALIAAEAKGIKRIALFHMPEYFPGPNRPPGGFGLLPSSNVLEKLRDKALAKLFFAVLHQYKDRLNQVRRKHGLSDYDNIIEIYHQADLRLIQTTKAFDAPIEPSPNNVRYVGPILDDPIWADSADFSFLAKSNKPKILVSLSSTFQNQKALLERIIHAISKLDVACVITLGPAMEKESFKQYKHIHLLSSAPHNQLMPKVDAVITHAGHGTVMRSLSFGKPLICLPMGRDQLDNAALVQHHGAGLKLDKNSSAKKIRKALNKILQNKSFEDKAKILSKEIKKDLEEERAVHILEAS